MKEVKPGDYVVLDSGQEGYFIHDIGWRATTLRPLRNNLIVVPNTKMTDAIITNFELPNRPYGVLLGIGVSYASDLKKVERVSIEVAKEVIQRIEGTVKEFEPVVRFHTFGDSSINYNLIVQCTEFPAQYADSARTDQGPARALRSRRNRNPLPHPHRVHETRQLARCNPASSSQLDTGSSANTKVTGLFHNHQLMGEGPPFGCEWIEIHARRYRATAESDPCHDTSCRPGPCIPSITVSTRRPWTS